MLSKTDIKDKIFTIRNKQVMIDSDLAGLYEVQTKNLNKAVSRNIERFPDNFMFRLTESEYNSLRFQNGTLNKPANLEDSGSMRGKHRKFMPYVFTEQGVAMLSGILTSKVAIEISIQIIDAFVSMRQFLAQNGQIIHRINNMERKQIEHDSKFELVFKAIEDKNIKPEKGIYFDGQVFDAYNFVSDLIRSAKKSITLLDNYIDDSVLILLSKRKKGVSTKIYTMNLSEQLKLDLEKFNSQYEPIKITKFKESHDRFLIIDDKYIYHMGASLKDLGKKWFAFSRFGKNAIMLLDRIKNL